MSMEERSDTEQAVVGGESTLAAEYSQSLREYPVTGKATSDIATRFEYHAPKDDQGKRYTYLRSQFRCLAYEIVRYTPPSREQSLALTKLEEAMMHANSAIARNE